MFLWFLSTQLTRRNMNMLPQFSITVELRNRWSQLWFGCTMIRNTHWVFGIFIRLNDIYNKTTKHIKHIYKSRKYQINDFHQIRDIFVRLLLFWGRSKKEFFLFWLHKSIFISIRECNLFSKKKKVINFFYSFYLWFVRTRKVLQDVFNWK